MNVKNEKILFICRGNVGRSQMAEGFWKQWFGEDTATSAGTEDVGADYNFHPREDIVLAMKEKGIDISTQKIKLLAKDMLQDIATVVVFCEKQLLPDFLLSSEINIVYRPVPDPYESNMDGVRQIRDEIESQLLELEKL